MKNEQHTFKYHIIPRMYVSFPSGRALLQGLAALPGIGIGFAGFDSASRLRSYLTSSGSTRHATQRGTEW